MKILLIYSEMAHLVGGLHSIFEGVLEMHISISHEILWYMKLVPPFTPIAKLYGARYLVKRMLLFLTIVNVRALSHPPPTARGRSLVRSLWSL